MIRSSVIKELLNYILHYYGTMRFQITNSKSRLRTFLFEKNLKKNRFNSKSIYRGIIKKIGL